jgi:hypothetical protein
LWRHQRDSVSFANHGTLYPIAAANRINIPTDRGSHVGTVYLACANEPTEPVPHDGALFPTVLCTRNTRPNRHGTVYSLVDKFGATSIARYNAILQ